jgi:MoaA/NifB/PqqE/SkfB family radical SAM enzyme
MNVKFVYVSLYSHISKVHDFITNIAGSHAATVTTINKLVDAGIDVRINHVLTRQNISDIIDILQFSSNMKVSEVRLLRLVEHGRAKETWSTIGLTKEEQDIAIATVFMQRQHDVRITVAGFPELTACRPFDLGPSCQAGSRLFFIDKLGDVYPCACRKNDPSSVLLHLGDYPLPVTSCVSKSCLQDYRA